MDGEVSLVFAGRSGDDEAEESFSDAGEVIVVFHAVGRQGGGVDGDSEAVLYVEGVHAGVFERDGEHIVLDGCIGNVCQASGVDGVLQNPDLVNDVIGLRSISG